MSHYDALPSAIHIHTHSAPPKFGGYCMLLTGSYSVGSMLNRPGIALCSPESFSLDSRASAGRQAGQHAAAEAAAFR